MTYKEILSMVRDSTFNTFEKGVSYDGIQKGIVECATKIYIKQMELEKEKLQEEYDDLCEGHDKLSYEWAKLKKENRELSRKYSELLEDSNRKSNEPVEETMTLDDWLKEKEEEKNAEE